MRSLVTSPDPSTVSLFNGDLSNIEARVLAWMLLHYQKDYSLANNFLEGLDFHTANAESWGVSRDNAKTLLFAILYGAGAARIGITLKCGAVEAQALIDKLRLALPAVFDLKENFWEGCRYSGGISHTMLGRRLVYPDIVSHKKSLVEAAKRQSFNAFIQGSAGDILKTITVECLPIIHSEGGVIAAAVHDEILGYVPVDNADSLCTRLSQTFSASQLLAPVPISADFHHGESWHVIH